MDIKRCDNNHLNIDFHYCPLAKAWQKQGCSDEEIQLLCNQATCGDRGIAESFGCELDLPSTIAWGIVSARFGLSADEGIKLFPFTCAWMIRAHPCFRSAFLLLERKPEMHFNLDDSILIGV